MLSFILACKFSFSAPCQFIALLAEWAGHSPVTGSLPGLSQASQAKPGQGFSGVMAGRHLLLALGAAYPIYQLATPFIASSSPAYPEQAFAGSERETRETLGGYGLRETSVKERRGSAIHSEDKEEAQAPRQSCRSTLKHAAARARPSARIGSGWICTSTGKEPNYGSRSSATCSHLFVACACSHALRSIQSQKHD